MLMKVFCWLIFCARFPNPFYLLDHLSQWTKQTFHLRNASCFALRIIVFSVQFSTSIYGEFVSSCTDYILHASSHMCIYQQNLNVVIFYPRWQCPWTATLVISDLISYNSQRLPCLVLFGPNQIVIILQALCLPSSLCKLLEVNRYSYLFWPWVFVNGSLFHGFHPCLSANSNCILDKSVGQNRLEHSNASYTLIMIFTNPVVIYV